MCFNPCRVFSGLATITSPITVEVSEAFQSLSGFFRPCNFSFGDVEVDLILFQSLSGFFRPCNPAAASVRLPLAILFQSLSGFFRPCNFRGRPSLFSTKESFQSLSGFFRPCNSMDRRGARTSRSSFNPCRVFSGLATLLAIRVRCPLPSFNPCRVFSGLATSKRERGDGAGKGFNPCRVFSGLATTIWTCDCTGGFWVSIPVGFFQALQPKSRFLIRLVTSWFQSLSGFFRPCNNLPGGGYARIRRVSIPVGFFQALQP